MPNAVPRPCRLAWPSHGLGLGSGRRQGRQQNGHEQGDDRHHHEDFDQREGTSADRGLPGELTPADHNFLLVHCMHLCVVTFVTKRPNHGLHPAGIDTQIQLDTRPGGAEHELVKIILLDLAVARGVARLRPIEALALSA